MRGFSIHLAKSASRWSSWLVPMQEGWTIRREPWLTPLPGIPHADRDPPG